jgi:hypothetical protein
MRLKTEWLTVAKLAFPTLTHLEPSNFMTFSELDALKKT